jgi:DNA helicase-2/ATP-dependent DNA helicase PcrA
MDDSVAAGALFVALEPPTASDSPFCVWLQAVDQAQVGLALGGSKRYADEAIAWDGLLPPTSADAREMTIAEFAHGARPIGKVILTNFHNAKGRQFQAVIIPGLQRGLMPYQRWRRHEQRFLPPVAQGLQDDRRLFYVGITRASGTVFLVWSDHHTDRWANVVPSGPSPFIAEIRTRLDYP